MRAPLTRPRRCGNVVSGQGVSVVGNNNTVVASIGEVGGGDYYYAAYRAEVVGDDNQLKGASFVRVHGSHNHLSNTTRDLVQGDQNHVQQLLHAKGQTTTGNVVLGNSDSISSSASDNIIFGNNASLRSVSHAVVIALYSQTHVPNATSSNASSLAADLSTIQASVAAVVGLTPSAVQISLANASLSATATTSDPAGLQASLTASLHSIPGLANATVSVTVVPAGRRRLTQVLYTAQIFITNLGTGNVTYAASQLSGVSFDGAYLTAAVVKGTLVVTLSSADQRALAEATTALTQTGFSSFTSLTSFLSGSVVTFPQLDGCGTNGNSTFVYWKNYQVCVSAKAVVLP